MEDNNQNSKKKNPFIAIVVVLLVISLCCTIFGFMKKYHNYFFIEKYKGNSITNNNADNGTETTNNIPNKSRNTNKDISNNDEDEEYERPNVEEPSEIYDEYEYEDEYDREFSIIRNGNIPNCAINYLKDTKIELKNIKAVNSVITSDVYINGIFSKNISYYVSPYNYCLAYEPRELKKDYFILDFFWGDIPLPYYTYLFNKNGTYITDFKEWKRKYDGKYGLGSIQGSDKSDLSIVYNINEGMEMDLVESYCELEAKPDDIFSIVEYIDIENDELKVINVDKTTWKEAYLCEDGQEEDCGDITKIDCSNLPSEHY